MTDFFVPEFVNRQPQLDAFGQILEGSLGRRLFLIEGEAEIGKSFLVEQFLHMAAASLTSRLDFRDGELHTFLSMIHTAMRDLGQASFGRTLAEIERLTIGGQHSVQIRGETIHRREPVNWARLRLLVLEHFNDSDLRDLCFDLRVEYDDLPGEGRAAKARELLDYMERYGRLLELREQLERQRPAAPWQEAFATLDVTSGGNARPTGEPGQPLFLPATGDRFQQQFLQQRISTLFFDELAAVAGDQVVVLTYDSFEAAPPDAGQWISGLLLDEVGRGRLPQLVVLVSGRKVFDVAHSLSMKTIRTRLTGFDLEAAGEFWVRRQGLPAELLADVFAETAGHPRRLVEKALAAGGRQFNFEVMVI